MATNNGHSSQRNCFHDWKKPKPPQWTDSTKAQRDKSPLISGQKRLRHWKMTMRSTSVTTPHVNDKETPTKRHPYRIRTTTTGGTSISLQQAIEMERTRWYQHRKGSSKRFRSRWAGTNWYIRETEKTTKRSWNKRFLFEYPPFQSIYSKQTISLNSHEQGFSQSIKEQTSTIVQLTYLSRISIIVKQQNGDQKAHLKPERPTSRPDASIYKYQ